METLPIERAFALALKIQAGGRGVDAGPTLADDALRLGGSFDLGRDYVSPNQLDGEQTGGKGTAPGAQKAGLIYTIPATRRMRGTGAVYSGVALPEEDALLMAILGVRNVDTTGGQEKVEYSGADNDEALLTGLAQTIGEQYVATDLVPRSASIEWEAGKYLMLSAELAGVGAPPTQQALGAATLDTVRAPVLRGGTFTLNGVSLAPIKGSLDFGLSVADAILDGRASDAWAGYKVVDRAPTGTMEVQVTDLATFNPYALHDASTPVAWVMELGGPQYNDIRIEADRLEITGVSTVNRGGVKAWSLTYRIHRAIAPSVKDPLITFQ